MQHKMGIYLARGFIASILPLLFAGTLWAGSPGVLVEVRGPVIDIRASQVPLADVLKALSEKTGIRFEFPNPPESAFSCDMKSAAPEEAIKGLLAGYSYSVSYRPAGEGGFFPDKVVVMDQSGGLPPPPPPGLSPEVRRIDADGLILALSDERQAKAVAAEPSKEGPGGGGFRITMLSDESAFLDLGVAEGDVIDSVNGRAVNSVAEFIEALRAASQVQPAIRISRMRGDKTMDPIYIDVAPQKR